MALISIKLFPSCQAYNHMSHSYFGHHITLYVLVYVDDILLTGSPFKLIHDLITKLHDKFTLKLHGKPQYFLSIKVHHQPNKSMLLIQTKYISDLLSKVNMNFAKGVPTPMVNTCKLSKHGTNVLTGPLLYRLIVEALQYLTLT